MNDEAMTNEQAIEGMLRGLHALHEENEANKFALRKATDLVIAFGNLIDQLEHYAKRNEALTLEEFQELKYFFTAHISETDGEPQEDE